MKKETPSTEFTTELAHYREEIDALDDKIIALFIERIDIVNRVGALKKKHHPGQCPLKSGREAEMVRRVVEKFKHTPFSSAAAATMWRTLIGASTAVEGSLKLSVYAPDGNDALYWLGREYFGPFIPSIRQPHINRVIGDVLDNKASVGIVPLLQRNDDSHWWTNLIQPGPDTPKIFAYIPFVQYPAANHDTMAGFAIARIQPEPSGNDKSLWVLEVDHDISQTRLQTVFSDAKLETSWINIATLAPNRRHHLVEINGFVSPQQDTIQNVLNGLGKSIINACFLGAYAVPMTLPFIQPKEPGVTHAPRTAKA